MGEFPQTRETSEGHRFVACGRTVVIGGASPAERRAIERLFEERHDAYERSRAADGRLGSIVLARAVDDALELLAGDGFVSAGGAFAVRGGGIVSLPGGDALTVYDGGLATVGAIDLQATVLSESCLDATIAATVAVMCEEDGPAWLDSHELAGRFLSADGVILENRSWGEALARATGEHAGL